MLGELSECEDFPRVAMAGGGKQLAMGGGGKQLAVCATLVRLLESAVTLPPAVTLSATRGVKNAALEPTLCAGPSPIRVRVRVRVRVTCESG